MGIKLKNKKQFFLLFSTLAISTGWFWFTSRYPNLNQKSVMGARTSTLGIAFDILWEIKSDHPFYLKLLYGFLNWIYTNWKGMLFGFVFGAHILTILPLMEFKGKSSSFLNAFKGMILGAPLGVCANCATPVSRALGNTGLPPQVSLALVSSSPSLNIIGLTMLFTFFPLSMAVIKLFFVFVYLLIVIPLIVPKNLPHKTPSSCEGPASENKNHEIVIKLFSNFIWILKKTIPLMLLAGFLGNAAITFIPPQLIEHVEFNFFSLTLFALIGVFLPVPMTFDLIAAHALMLLGLPIGLCMTLLFTLGIFSIYPFLQLRQILPTKVLVYSMTILTSFGILSGGSIEIYQAQANKKLAKMYFSEDPDSATALAGLFQVAKGLCPGDEECSSQIITEAAKKLKNSALCSPLKKEIKNRCLDQVYMARAQDNETLCHQHPQPYNCFKETYLNIATMNPPLVHWRCNQKIPQYAALCEDALLILRAGIQNSPGLCQKFVKDPKQWQRCLFNVQGARLIRGEVSNEICQELTGKIRQECFGKTQAVSSLKNFNVNGCNQLTGPSKSICQKEFVKIGFEKSQNPLFCHLLKHDTALLAECQKERNRREHQRVVTQYWQKIIGNHAIIGPEDNAETIGLNSKNPVLNSPAPPSFKFKDLHDLKIDYIPFNSTKGNSKLLTRLTSSEFSLPLPESRLLEFQSYSGLGHGVATGDLNGDHYPEILITHNKGFSLFWNRSGKGFQAKLFPLANFIPGLSPFIVTFVGAMVDFNNDNLLDIFISTYAQGNYIFFNDGNSFDNPKWIKLPSKNEILTSSASFGDFNKDGFIDIYVGNWTRPIPQGWHSTSKNYLLINHLGRKFQIKGLPTYSGDTWSSVASDINHDGFLDLLVANDFTAPDAYLTGDRQGDFKRAQKEKGLPHTPYANMSFDTADINNDLKLDAFAAEVSYGLGEVNNYCQILPSHRQTWCQEFLQALDSVNTLDLASCNQYSSKNMSNDCRLGVLYGMAIHAGEKKYCNMIPDNFLNLRHACLKNIDVKSAHHPIKKEDIEQINESNSLFIAQKGGGFKDLAKQFGVHATHWSWSAKFADLNNDEWQDLYVANGHHIRSNIVTNRYFQNLQGKSFQDLTQTQTDKDFFSTKSFSYFDFDLDGDLDLVLTGLLGPARILKNNSMENNSIAFYIKSNSGASWGIGTKAIVHYGTNLAQLRELKLGGGVASYDQPIMHFGLGGHQHIDSIELQWPDGTLDKIEGPFPANRLYILTPSKSSKLASTH